MPPNSRHLHLCITMSLEAMLDVCPLCSMSGDAAVTDLVLSLSFVKQVLSKWFANSRLLSSVHDNVPSDQIPDVF